jgi:hypothetical protein
MSSLHYESKSSSWESGHFEPRLEGGAQHADEAPQGPAARVVVPLEGRFEARTTLRDEYILQNNFDIQSFVMFHFQDPVIGTMSGGEVCLFERMFLVGLHLPFPAIAQELLLFLNVAPSQIMLNRWRYLFALYIL